MFILYGGDVGDCLNCGKRLSASDRKYCSIKCQHKYKYDDKIRKWLSGEDSGGKDFVSITIKRYMKEQSNGQCSICLQSEWMGKPMPLVLDHIDGNPLDHRRENLRMVCGNCDMQLPTYKAKNIGNGRAYRRERYAQGKSC